MTAATCAACHEPLVEPYFEINRTAICIHCRGPIERQLRGKLGPARLGRALVFGLFGSAIGVGIYLAAPILLGVELRPLAVAIGYAVGKLVRRGGGGFGGMGCRLIAVALTYASFGVAYLAVEALTIGPERQVELPAKVGPAEIPTILGLIAEMPLLQIQWAPYQIMILAFGLWQAWRLNRPGRFLMTGPHDVAGAGGLVPVGESRPAADPR